MSGKPYPTAPSGGSYPTQPQHPAPQQGAYPTAYPQSQYPASSYPYQQPGYGAGAPPAYQAAPPPYSAAPAYQPQPGGMAPPPAANYQPYYPAQPQQTVVAPGLWDQGARFDGISQARVPPPPPGVAPNAAQLATMQGQTVIGSQERSNWMTGGGRNDPGINWGF